MRRRLVIATLAVALVIVLAIVVIPFVNVTSMPIPLLACLTASARYAVPPMPAFASVAYCFLGMEHCGWLNGTYYPLTKSTMSHPDDNANCPSAGAQTEG